MGESLRDRAGAFLLDRVGDHLYTRFGSDPSTGGGDTSDFGGAADPIFYDWWRKRAKEEREKFEAAKEDVLAEVEAEDVPLREETIDAIEAADSLADLRQIELLQHERAALNQLMREYQRYLDEDEEETEALLLAILH